LLMAYLPNVVMMPMAVMPIRTAIVAVIWAAIAIIAGADAYADPTWTRIETNLCRGR